MGERRRGLVAETTEHDWRPCAPVGTRLRPLAETVKPVLASLLLLTCVSCTPAMYERDVTAHIEGPSQIAVGEQVLLLVRLDYSDGTSSPAQPSPIDGRPVSTDGRAVWISSDPSRATVGRDSGLATGIAPGEVLITATPTVLSTGTGRRIPGTLRLTVIE